MIGLIALGNGIDCSLRSTGSCADMNGPKDQFLNTGISSDSWLLGGIIVLAIVVFAKLNNLVAEKKARKEGGSNE